MILLILLQVSLFGTRSLRVLTKLWTLASISQTLTTMPPVNNSELARASLRPMVIQ